MLTMAGKDDNLARKMTNVDTSEVDAGWESPESGTHVDKVTQVDPAVLDEWTQKIGEMIDKTLDGSKWQVVSQGQLDIEDIFKPGHEALKKQLSPIPEGLTIISGEPTMKKLALDGFEDKKIFISTYPGLTSLERGLVPSRDGISVMVRENPLEKNKTVSIVLVHSQAEEDSDAAALVNAASIAAANHIAREVNMPRATDVFSSMGDAIETAKKELEYDDDLSMMHLLLEKDEHDAVYKLDLAKYGKLHCMTIDPHTGKYDFMKVPLKSEPFRTRHKEHGLTEDELQEMYDEGATRDEWVVAPGEIILLATDQVVEMLGGRDALVAKALDLRNQGKDLQEIGSIFIEALRLREEESPQTYKDQSATVVLFEAP